MLFKCECVIKSQFEDLISGYVFESPRPHKDVKKSMAENPFQPFLSHSDLYEEQKKKESSKVICQPANFTMIIKTVLGLMKEKGYMHTPDLHKLFRLRMFVDGLSFI